MKNDRDLRAVAEEQAAAKALERAMGGSATETAKAVIDALDTMRAAGVRRFETHPDGRVVVEFGPVERDELEDGDEPEARLAPAPEPAGDEPSGDDLDLAHVE